MELIRGWKPYTALEIVFAAAENKALRTFNTALGDSGRLQYDDPLPPSPESVSTEGWITAKEAASIVDTQCANIYIQAKLRGWPVLKLGWRRTFFRIVDVEAWKVQLAVFRAKRLVDKDQLRGKTQLIDQAGV